MEVLGFRVLRVPSRGSIRGFIGFYVGRKV